MNWLIDTFQHIPPLWLYLLVGVFLMLESCGIPVINTTLLLFAGSLAFLGRLHLGLLIFSAILGSILGACSAYGLGRRYGEPLLLRIARILHIDERKVFLAERWFRSSGSRMIFVSRITPYIRPFSCFVGGILHMPFLRFFSAALSGSVIWCVTFLLIGWKLGPGWPMAMQLVQLYTFPVLGGLVLLLLLSWFLRRMLNNYVKRHLNFASSSDECK